VHNLSAVNDRFLKALALSVVVMGACGGEENRPATWSYISPAIIQPNCATGSCHNTAAAIAGLDLSEKDAGWKSLMQQKLPSNRPITAATYPNGQPPRPLVTPGNPEESRLLNSLRAFGANLMPPNRPLAEADIALVETWILKGAKND
jgi:hypothetical protein